MKCIWDENKNEVNIKKHGISFSEAETVFLDDYAMLIDDVIHSKFEDRFLILGMSRKLNVLIVCHCYRSENIIRIISARKATKYEIEQYERG